ncbi:MAG: hypothetical protein HYX92_22415 [Chloroflexi bacterium]|nr:hypothetical protein [Chloroflexota bacterium]
MTYALLHVREASNLGLSTKTTESGLARSLVKATTLRRKCATLSSLHKELVLALNQTRSFASPLDEKGYLDDNACCVSQLLDPTSFIRELSQEVFNAAPELLDRDIVLFLLIDQFDQLTAAAQNVVHSIVYRAPTLRCFCKIAVRTACIRSAQDANGRRLSIPHDIHPVPIGYPDPEDTQYLEFMETLTRTRLEEYARHKNLPQMLTDPKNLFEPFDAAAAIRDVGSASLDEVERAVSEMQTLSLSAQPRDTVQRYKILDHLVSRGAIFQQQSRKYGGFEQLCILASGVVRSFLILCSTAWNQEMSSARQSPEVGGTISVESQSVSVTDFANMSYSALGHNLLRGDEGRRLVDGFAKETIAQWSAPKMDRPGAHLVEIQTSERKPLSADAASLLHEMIQGSVCLGEEQDVLCHPVRLRLSRIYCPKHNLSPYSLGPVRMEVKRLESMVAPPLGRPSDTEPKSFFFSIAFPRLDWHEWVRSTLQEISKTHGVEYREGERHHYAEVIGADVRKLIKNADFVIVDISDRKPSVFMEYGMAVAAGRPTFLWHNETIMGLFQKSEVPFIIPRVNSYSSVMESLERMLSTARRETKELPRRARKWYCPSHPRRYCPNHDRSIAGTIFLEGPDRNSALAWWSMEGRLRKLAESQNLHLVLRNKVASKDVCEVCDAIRQCNCCIIDSSAFKTGANLHTCMTIGFAFQLRKPVLHLYSRTAKGFDTDWLGIKAHEYGDQSELVDIAETWLSQEGARR